MADATFTLLRFEGKADASAGKARPSRCAGWCQAAAFALKSRIFIKEITLVAPLIKGGDPPAWKRPEVHSLALGRLRLTSG